MDLGRFLLSHAEASVSLSSVTLKKNTCTTFKIQRWITYSDFELFVIDPFQVQEQNVGVISKAPLSPGHGKRTFQFFKNLGWKHEFQSQERKLENLGRENQKPRTPKPVKIVQQFSFTIRHPETMFEKFLPNQPTILKQMTPYALLYSMERPSMLIKH